MNYYSHDPKFGSQYYIHAHMVNIGRMGNRAAQTPSTLYTIFTQEKENAKKAVKKQYKNLFTQAISKESLQLLDGSFEYGSDEFFNVVNEQIQKDFQENLRTEKITQLLNIEKNLFSKSSLARLQQELTNKTSEFKELDNIITVLSECVKIIGGPYAKELVASLLATTKQGSVIGYGQALTKWAKDGQQKIEQNKTSISRTKMLQVLKFIEPLGKLLTKGRTSKGKPLSASSLKALIENTIFSTGFGEAVALEVNRQASQGISMALKDLETSGTDQVRITVTDTEGNRIKEEGIAAAGKADLKFKNYTIHLDQTDKEIKVEIGISNKFYKSGTVYQGDTKEHVQGNFSSGKGLTLGRAIAQTFTKYNQYLAFNTYAWENSSNGVLKPATGALQNAMLTRNIISLFGSRGENDFAQFMLLNGELVSIWDMIQYAIQNDVGLTESELNRTGKSQGIVMSLGSTRQDFNKFLTLSTKERVIKTNAIISSAKITAHIHPNLLLQALQK